MAYRSGKRSAGADDFAAVEDFGFAAPAEGFHHPVATTKFDTVDEAAALVIAGTAVAVDIESIERVAVVRSVAEGQRRLEKIYISTRSVKSLTGSAAVLWVF